MKIMISQPMNNKSNDQIKKERENIINDFKKLHIEVLDTIIEDTANPKKYNEYHPALFYMAKSIDFMAQVDAVYFMDGWKEARGCRIEHQICEEYGIKILDSTFFNLPRVFTTRAPWDNNGINIMPCSTSEPLKREEYTITCSNNTHKNDNKEWQSGNHIPRID